MLADMTRAVRRLTALILLAAGLAACATMSDEEQCKQSGGVWRGTSCERPAK